MTRQQDVAPSTAFLAALVSMAEATRRTGRRSWGRVRRRRRPAAFRDDAWIYPRRPADYVAAGIVVGSTGAFALVALGRAVRGRPGGGPGSRLAWMRTAAMRAVRQRARSTQADHGDRSAGVAVVPAPGPKPSVVADAAGGEGRHTSGAPAVETLRGPSASRPRRTG